MTTRTLLGTLSSGPAATVDDRGLVTPLRPGLEWSLDWWVGADDRWHLPQREPAVRQTRLGPGPVTETAMRVSGGDAVHRCAAVPAGRGGAVAVLVEVENRSPSPFALALAVRPPAGEIATRGAVVDVDGRPGLQLSVPARLGAGSTARERDVLDTVLAGGAGAEWPDPLRCRRRGASAAFLVPVAHRATVRAAVLVDGAELPSPWPDLAAVADSWEAIARRGTQVEVPEPALQAAIDAARATLLLADVDDPAAVELAPALDDWGFAGEADRAIRAAWATERRDGSFATGTGLEHLAALAHHVALTGDASILADLDEHAIAAAEHRLERGAVARAPRHVSIDDALAAASPTWSFPDGIAGAARFLGSVRRLLVGPGLGGAVLGALRPGWAGAPIEVRSAPTGIGPLSYAVRWHGPRPALLWEVGGDRTGSPGLRLTAAGLDGAWSTTDPTGETLLSGR